MIVSKKYKDLKSVLMDPTSQPLIKNPYSIIAEENQTIFVISSGLNGVEYNKTEVMFSNYEGIQIYQCLYGQGVLLMQRNDQVGEAKEFKVVTLNASRQVGVPAGWLISLVNIGKIFLVVVANVSLDSIDTNLKEINKKRGLAYYVLEKKGEISFKQNSNYTIHPQITTE